MQAGRHAGRQAGRQADAQVVVSGRFIHRIESLGGRQRLFALEGLIGIGVIYELAHVLLTEVLRNLVVQCVALTLPACQCDAVGPRRTGAPVLRGL
jgi:hypothetical protein